MTEDDRPVVIITGASGNIGQALVGALGDDFHVVGFDLDASDEADFDQIVMDVTSDESVDEAFRSFRERFGGRIASVIHLAAFFDFSGEENPLYEKVNEEGTRRLIRALGDFDVEQFVYSGTMLIHRPGKPGETIDESAPIEPKWAYPQSKARTEEIIVEERDDIPVVLLHLAGLYDEESGVPTLTHQIARIYERDMKSRFYPADMDAGQAFIHKDDLVRVVHRAVERRRDLEPVETILAGETDVMSFRELQDGIGRLIHGESEWQTLRVPKELATVAAWAEEKAEPVIPDAYDRGEKPFIKPFMIEMAEDHYALDISRARRKLGWEPRRSMRETLPALVAALLRDPLGWYRKNGITPPTWMEGAEEESANPEDIRREHERKVRKGHRAALWAPFVNIGLGAWLITSPMTLGYETAGMMWSDLLCGALVMMLAFLSLSWRLAPVRWLIAGLGMWVSFAPLVFWTPSAAAYLNGTLVGGLVAAFAVLVGPTPGVSPLAETRGPRVPPGWDVNPSSWSQRAVIIMLAFVGLFASRYLAAYQLGHIDTAWDPFFAGGPGPKNGTEEVITSSVSEAWPVPDAGIGAVAYLLEILTGLLGSTRRWRTMPWLVILFGILIVPLGIVSITFIIIQPIVIGTWCAICLLQAAAMLLQIPYSLDELVATGQFLKRRKRAGRPILRVFLFGDTDEDAPHSRPEKDDDFERPARTVFADMIGGGVAVPWNIGVCLLIGVWLMFTRLTLGAEGALADMDHLVGSLVITVSVIAFAEVARAVRFANMALGAAIIVVPFVTDAGVASMVADSLCGLALILLSFRKGRTNYHYGSFDRLIR